MENCSIKFSYKEKKKIENEIIELSNLNTCKMNVRINPGDERDENF